MKEYGRLPATHAGIYPQEADIHAVPLFNAIVPAAYHLAQFIYIAERIGVQVLEAGIDCHGYQRYALSYDLRLDVEHCAKFDCILGTFNNRCYSCPACLPEEDLDIEFYGCEDHGADHAAELLIDTLLEEDKDVGHIYSLFEELKSRKRIKRKEFFGIFKIPVFPLEPGFKDTARRYSAEK